MSIDKLEPFLVTRVNPDHIWNFKYLIKKKNPVYGWLED